MSKMLLFRKVDVIGLYLFTFASMLSTFGTLFSLSGDCPDRFKTFVLPFHLFFTEWVGVYFSAVLRS